MMFYLIPKMKMEFVIDQKPTRLNRLYGIKTTHGGRTIKYKTQAAKDYTQLVRWMLKIQKAKKIEKPVKMKMEFFWTKKEPDIDAYLKLVLDIFEGFVYENDKQIKELIVKKKKSLDKEFKMIIHVDEI